MLFIGVDLGTSAVKLLLMDEEGDIKKIGYNQPAGVRYPTENPWG